MNKVGRDFPIPAAYQDGIPCHLHNFATLPYFELGETAQAESLFGDWLHADPCWGWGWIGWSDGYGITRTKFQDWQQAEQILREELAVDQVRDRGDLLERLADVYEEQGRKVEAIELRKQAKRGVAATTVTRQKIGRNEPCPCGSGKSSRSAVALDPASHTHARQFRTDPSSHANLI